MKKYTDLDQYSTIEQLIVRLDALPHNVSEKEWYRVKEILQKYLKEHPDLKDQFGIHPLARRLLTATTLVDEMGIGGTPIMAVLLQLPLRDGVVTQEELKGFLSEDVLYLLRLMQKVTDLYAKNAVVTSDNFSHFLLSFAEDVRVILILISERLVQLRLAGDYLSEDLQLDLSMEASFLYAPLAHRMGLYNIKGEMEDFCLKYTDREIYNFIKDKLAATKKTRDTYIASFIDPVKKALEESGLMFTIKGRTKSISSIRNKLVKQKIEFEAIYDLFAIRVIIDAPLEEERSQCWKAYSIITDMYQPNPKRMKDWLSIPKSNGYESLHITVLGPQQKWVEVQIRTERMDEIAEKGLAAHWRYKGVKSESGLDEFMTTVRRTLENKSATSEEVMQEFRMNLYDEEIYVFTPKGNLVKLPKGASILDFAYAIHSGIGEKTVSAQVNGRNVSIRQQLQNGDTVSINTSANQTPKQDWLRYVITSKARNKIKQWLRIESEKSIQLVREELNRRLRNRKLEYDEAVFTKLVRRKGYKATSHFFLAIQNKQTDLDTFLDEYKLAFQEPEQAEERHISADKFVSSTLPEKIIAEETEDILTIDNNLSGIDYQLAKCCNPIYGDKIFAFTSRSGIRIHRMNCPNAPDLFNRFGYRILKARWKGDTSRGSEVVLRVIGHDDLSVVNAVVSQVGTEKELTLRSYNIQSADGLFQATLHIYIKEASRLNPLLKSLRTLPGIKSVERV